MATAESRNTLGADAVFRRRVRTIALASAYDITAATLPGSPTAAELARRAFSARLLQARDTQLTDRIAELMAAKLPDAQVDAAGGPSDAQLTTAMPIAIDALGNVAAAS